MATRTGHDKTMDDLLKDGWPVALASIIALMGWLARKIQGLEQWKAGHEAASQERHIAEDSAVLAAKNSLKRVEQIAAKLDLVHEELRAMDQRCVTHLSRVAGNFENK